jgi:hypothetical protein
MPWAVVGAVAGAAISADASRSAANKQSDASTTALEEQARQFDKSLEWQKEIGLATMGGEQAMYDQQRQDQIDQRNQSRSDFSEARDQANGYYSTARDQVVGDYAPTVQYGQNAQNQLQYAMGLGGTGNGEAGALSRDFTSADFVKDPGYDFRMQEGQNSVNNKFAASGNLLSGAALKALERFNQDYASSEYGAAYGRFKTNQGDQYNRLSGMVNTGQNALAQTSNARMNAASGMSNAAMGAGSGMSGAGISATNAMQQAGTSAQNGISQAYSTMGTNGSNTMNALGKAYADNAYNQGNIGAQQQMAYGKAFGNGLSGLTSAWNSYQSQPSTFNPQGNGGGYDFGGSTGGYYSGPSQF